MEIDGSSPDITRLLKEWSGGDGDASLRLIPLVYEELRRQARAHLGRERSNHTLQATALVHEAFLRLVDVPKVSWQSRAHFYGIAARLMRRILVDHARTQNAVKRGGVEPTLRLDDVPTLGTEGAVELVALDSALEKFTDSYPRKGRVVELKFFGGMEMKEIAEVLQISEKTALRDWSFAKLWLHRALSPNQQNATRA